MKNPTMILLLFKFVSTMVFLLNKSVAEYEFGFIYNGFRDAANLHLDGVVCITPNGILILNNDTTIGLGRSFYSRPLKFKINNSSSSPPDPNGNTTARITTLSFSTTFIYAIIPQYYDLSANGIAFFLSPHREPQPGPLPSQYLGLFNASNNGNPSNHVVAVELDTNYSPDVNDIDDNHVGIDINSVNSVQSSRAKYFSSKEGGFRDLSLTSGQPIQVWVEYDGVEKQLNVTIAPINIPKPDIPLLSLSQDISTVILDSMYVGFSSINGEIKTSHYILGWSFKLNGRAQELDLSRLPKLPGIGSKKKTKLLVYVLPIFVPILVLTMILIIVFIIRRKRKFADIVEDWEFSYCSQRFRYKDLYIATGGFTEKELLGVGGFGKVYKGVLTTSKLEVAIKRVSHDSRQGVREFIAEIVSIGQIRHRNLVQLLGYCRRKSELLLIYDYMPNGSLDKFLFGRRMNSSRILNWKQRFKIIKDVASGLFYLHEGLEQVVIHRDIKASNILLDVEMNAKLGDFGLARLYDRGTNPQTTNVVGTFGFIAPELIRTGKATTSTDVFAFGQFLLEVACDKKPAELNQSETGEGVVLLDWVFSCWSKGVILETSDPNLRGEYVVEEMELILKLSLFCSHSVPADRPTMKQVLQYLEGDLPLPSTELLVVNMSNTINRAVPRGETFQDFALSNPSSVDKALTGSSSSIAESILSGGP